MTISKVQVIKDQPVVTINDCPVVSTTAYVGPRYVDTFLEAGFKLFTFSVPGYWWVELGEYAFTSLMDLSQITFKESPALFYAADKFRQSSISMVGFGESG